MDQPLMCARFAVRLAPSRLPIGSDTTSMTRHPSCGLVEPPPTLIANTHTWWSPGARTTGIDIPIADRAPQPPELACEKRFFRGFPEPGWSNALNASLAEAVQTRPDLSDAANAELEQIPVDEQWLREHRKSLGSRPIRVITAAQHKPDTIAAEA